MELPFGKHDRKSIFMSKSTISIAMFDSYVKLPEGRSCMFIISHQISDSLSVHIYSLYIYWDLLGDMGDRLG